MFITILKKYIDSDMVRDIDTQKSTLGYLFHFANGTVSWQFKLEKCVTLSTTDAQYIAAREASKELSWINFF